MLAACVKRKDSSGEPMPAFASYRRGGLYAPTEYPDSTHKWSQCSCFFSKSPLSPTFPNSQVLVILGSASSSFPCLQTKWICPSRLPIGGSFVEIFLAASKKHAHANAHVAVCPSLSHRLRARTKQSARHRISPPPVATRSRQAAPFLHSTSYPQPDTQHSPRSLSIEQAAINYTAATTSVHLVAPH